MPRVLLYPTKNGKTGRELVKAGAISADWPHTRAASFHVNGLEYLPIRPAECPLSTISRHWVCGSDADNVGLNKGIVNPATPAALRAKLEQQGSLVYPGHSAVYRWRAFREGTYFTYSSGAGVGGEGNGGQVGLGLFGAVNVQPRESVWYRSQVTHSDLQAATRSNAASATKGGHPYRFIDYDGARYASGPLKGKPILAMLDGNEIVHSDVNAVVALRGPTVDRNDTTGPDKPCKDYADGNSCGRSYREFTVIMHDEVKAVQAFAELEDQSHPLHYIKDGMGINYGVGGMGAMVVARNRKVGPVKNCPECRAEEFFLSSWANGDPALVLRWDKTNPTQPVGALYPDDPSNVHHSYLGDPVRFRNLHAGPKETHVFHLHAHQWVMDASDPGSTYLDSQTISPGATFSYEIAFGGGGNKNLAPGDSIFHCHLYPHFAQGMWELWRVHDVFEDGTPGLFNAKTNPRGRNYPDAEVHGGTENPALVPLPGTALPPMPTEDFQGYPFFVAGVPGHRPPQPPMDMDKLESGQYVDGGLQRHVLTDSGKTPGTQNTTKPFRTETKLINQDVVEEALNKGGLTARLNAAKVYKLNPNALQLAEVWESLGAVRLLNPEGEPSETQAMKFHEGELTAPGFVKAPAPTAPRPEWKQEAKGYVTDWANTIAGQTAPQGPAVFFVNGRKPAPGAPYADPCPADAPKRTYKAGVIQTELTVNRHGWFDPQARILALEQDIKDIINPNTRVRLPEPLFFRANSGDCITFKHSNFVPNAMGLDDFQIYTPTDTIGQHIHLVKFDVTSSDGSGNGWNYEDGTYSPEEVRERVFAYNRAAKTLGKPAADYLALKTHPLFKEDCRGSAQCMELQRKGTCPAWTEDRAQMAKMLATRSEEELRKLKKQINEEHPYCGAQRTVQRWWADPILDPKSGKDHTLRTVFTHDHFGPSTHQQHGLYAALVVEPANSVWLQMDANTLDWNKLCNGNEKDIAAERAKVLGGANLIAQFDAQCAQHATTQPSMQGGLRPPLALRDDGGPTSTRANIIAPKCLNKDSNPLNPAWNGTDCTGTHTNDTRREFGVAFADFAILYNTALEPINPKNAMCRHCALACGKCRPTCPNRWQFRPKTPAPSSSTTATSLFRYALPTLRRAKRWAASTISRNNANPATCNAQAIWPMHFPPWRTPIATGTSSQEIMAPSCRLHPAVCWRRCVPTNSGL